MRTFEILVPEHAIKKVEALLKEHGVVIKKSNAAKLKKLFDSQKTLLRIKDPLALQKGIRQEWEK